jgi:hypothetical protein
MSQNIAIPGFGILQPGLHQGSGWVPRATFIPGRSHRGHGGTTEWRYRTARPPQDRGGRLSAPCRLHAARLKARRILDAYPAAGYMTIIENWRQLADGQIEFTMRRLPTAD